MKCIKCGSEYDGKNKYCRTCNTERMREFRKLKKEKPIDQVVEMRLEIERLTVENAELRARPQTEEEWIKKWDTRLKEMNGKEASFNAMIPEYSDWAVTRWKNKMTKRAREWWNKNAIGKSPLSDAVLDLLTNVLELTDKKEGEGEC